DIIDGRVLGVDDTTHLGGLTFREAHLAAEFISETGLTRSISIGSVAAAASDPLGRQATFVDGLVASLLGRKVVKA
ncbi:alanine racemase, partial [Rhodococcus erythropolis]|nr:alanine racemase [Rhodococcus erythropolis]